MYAGTRLFVKRNYCGAGEVYVKQRKRQKKMQIVVFSLLYQNC